MNIILRKTEILNNYLLILRPTIYILSLRKTLQLLRRFNYKQCIINMLRNDTKIRLVYYNLYYRQSRKNNAINIVYVGSRYT